VEFKVFAVTGSQKQRVIGWPRTLFRERRDSEISMPLSWHIDDERGAYLTIRYLDPVTPGEWAEMAAAVTPQFKTASSMGLMIDRSGAAPPARAFTMSIADYLANHRAVFHGRRLAYLVRADDAAAFGMARMQEMLNERSGAISRVFIRESDARAWASGADLP
jgi:hypothetical protein